MAAVMRVIQLSDTIEIAFANDYSTPKTSPSLDGRTGSLQ